MRRSPSVDLTNLTILANLATFGQISSDWPNCLFEYDELDKSFGNHLVIISLILVTFMFDQ